MIDIKKARQLNKASVFEYEMKAKKELAQFLVELDSKIKDWSALYEEYLDDRIQNEALARKDLCKADTFSTYIFGYVENLADTYGKTQKISQKHYSEKILKAEDEIMGKYKMNGYIYEYGSGLHYFDHPYVVYISWADVEED